MEEQSKYYVPLNEEFYIGYEYEKAIVYGIGEQFEEDGMFPVSGWKKKIVDIIEQDDREIVDIPFNTFDKYLRVKYLDKEDIENCGWINVRDVEWIFNRKPAYMWAAEIDNIMIGYDSENYLLSITVKDPTKTPDGKEDEYEYPPKVGMYRGYCKSINELRKIMKLLGIK